MDTLDEIKASMRSWTDENIQREAEESRKVLTHHAATREDKDEARLILQAIKELNQESRQKQQEDAQAIDELVTTIKQAEREAADERQARIIARALKINGEHTAAAPADEPDSISTRAHRMSTEQYNLIAQYLKPDYAKAAFADDVSAIYKYLCQPRGKAEAQRIICRIYDKQLQSVYSNPKSNEHVTWIQWRDMFANAYGVKLTAKHAHVAQ